MKKVKKYVQMHQTKGAETALFDVTTKDRGANDQEIRLDYSTRDINWSPECRGTQAAKLIDHGNGYNVEFDNNVGLAIDYAQWEVLKGLMYAHNKFKKTQPNQFDTDIAMFKEVD